MIIRWSAVVYITLIISLSSPKGSKTDKNSGYECNKNILSPSKNGSKVRTTTTTTTVLPPPPEKPVFLLVGMNNEIFQEYTEVVRNLGG